MKSRVLRRGFPDQPNYLKRKQNLAEQNANIFARFSLFFTILFAPKRKIVRGKGVLGSENGLYLHCPLAFACGLLHTFTYRVLFHVFLPQSCCVFIQIRCIFMTANK